MTGLSGWWARRRQARTAARKYHVHAQRRRSALTLLARVRDPGVRAVLFQRAATATTRLAELHTTVHGVDPVDDPARPMAASLAHEAALYAALSDVELAVAYSTSRDPAVIEVETGGGRLLDKMAGTPDVPGRLALLDDLVDALAPVLGARAVAALITVRGAR